MSIRHVVALSGGKDSTAMALRLLECEPREYTFFCTPTGNELPEMVAHWSRLEQLIGQPLVRVHPFEGDGLLALIREQKMIPNFRARFCTRILKIEPAIEWLVEHSPCVQYVGLRYDEELRGGIYGEIPSVSQDYPLRRWGWRKQEVVEYLNRRGVTIPQRTDCGLCFYQQLREWKRLHAERPDRYNQGVQIEREIGHTFRSPSRDTWPADLAGLAKEFARKDPRGYNGGLFDSMEGREGMCRHCTI
ncbi:MAG TPA: phosphoadenosine phosphosulfate reductase family protein [Thermoguttaceae bacterium]|nr:phosphoadenosine phosphosulfate reductase family protein [Thermoguttaceae bacterium]